MGRRGCSPTSPARRRAATPTRSRRSSPASATSRWSTPTISSARIGNEPSEATSRASTTSAGSSRTRRRPGTHVNIAAAGVAAHAPHPDAAIAFLEYLRPPTAQAVFRQPELRVPGRATDAKVAEVPASLGTFRSDTLNLSALGENQPKAQADLQRDRLPLTRRQAEPRRRAGLIPCDGQRRRQEPRPFARVTGVTGELARAGDAAPAKSQPQPRRKPP